MTMTSGSATGYSTGQPRKVVEEITEQKFDENGQCVWRKVTKTERWVYDQTWTYPGATWTTNT